MSTPPQPPPTPPTPPTPPQHTPSPHAGLRLGDLKVYADSGRAFTTQLVVDVLFVCWLIGWVWIGSIVHDATMELAGPGDQAAASATSLSGSMTDAGDFLGDIPLIGGGVATPFEKAADASDALAAAGRAERAAVEKLAFWLGVAVAAIPILMAGTRYLPRRIRWIREATAGRRLVDGPADLELFAMRALNNQPLTALARVTDDPVGALRRGDTAIIRRLAELELDAHGLRAPAYRPAVTPGTLSG